VPRPASPTYAGRSQSPPGRYKPATPPLPWASYLIRAGTPVLPPERGCSLTVRAALPLLQPPPLPGKETSRGCEPILQEPPASSQRGLGKASGRRSPVAIPAPFLRRRSAPKWPLTRAPLRLWAQELRRRRGYWIGMAGDLMMPCLRLETKILSTGVGEGLG